MNNVNSYKLLAFLFLMPGGVILILAGAVLMEHFPAYVGMVLLVVSIWLWHTMIEEPNLYGIMPKMEHYVNPLPIQRGVIRRYSNVIEVRFSSTSDDPDPDPRAA